MTNLTSIHQRQPILTAGAPLESAQAAMILVHGRGASAEDILGLANEITSSGYELPLDASKFAFLAPQAAGNQWYPNRFMEPIASNEPYLSSALALLGDLVARVTTAGIPAEKIALLGFSQG